MFVHPTRNNTAHTHGIRHSSAIPKVVPARLLSVLIVGRDASILPHLKADRFLGNEK